VNFTLVEGFEADNHAPGGFGVGAVTCIDVFALGGVEMGGVNAIPTCISCGKTG
jgi:hypothetical protein